MPGVSETRAEVRKTLIILNRVDDMQPVHYGDPFCPMCRIAGVERPWLTTWFVQDVTCKRCKRRLP